MIPGTLLHNHSPGHKREDNEKMLNPGKGVHGRDFSIPQATAATRDVISEAARLKAFGNLFLPLPSCARNSQTHDPIAREM